MNIIKKFLAWRNRKPCERCGSKRQVRDIDDKRYSRLCNNCIGDLYIRDSQQALEDAGKEGKL